MGETSCLVENLTHYVPLSSGDLDLVATLEESEETVARGPVYETGNKVDRLFVLKHGWCFAASILPDSRRQIVKVYHPGDIIGFPDIAFTQASTDLFAAEDVVLCPFPKTRLDAIFQQSPLLTALLFTMALRDQVILIDYLQMLGRMSARERLSFFLLDLLARLRITNRHIGDTFRMPLTQSEIADTLGLTSVYVSKTFARLEADGLIRRGRSTIRVLDEARMAEMCEFTDRYAKIDTAWMPSG